MDRNRSFFLGQTVTRLSCVIATCLLSTLAFSAGCTWFKSDTDLSAKLESETAVDSPPADVSDGKKVRWDGGGVIIGETDTLAFTPESFLAAINRLAEQNRMASVQGMVESYVDIAIQTLQEAEATASNRESMQLIASLLDDRWCNEDLWQPWVEDLQALPKRSSDELDIRLRFWRFLKNNQPEKALKLKITKTLKREQGVMLRAEFHRLESIAAMMAEDHARSIENLETAIGLVKQPCPWYASKLQLLLGEFYRHADRWDDWKATWNAAVVSNSQLANNYDSIDPQFWNRAAFLRPAGMPWPTEVIANLKSVLLKLDVAETEHSLQLNSDEAVIWFAIGYQHLHRGEGQNSLLAFKKAEASENNQHTVKSLQLYQARSLVTSGQPGAASAILFRMVSDHDGTMLSDRAKAILASMKLQNGSVIQGINLIQSAMESIEDWPRDEQLRSHADYGLALLMRGQETKGLEQLEKAREAFELAGDMDQARQCLWNRAKYFEKTGQKEEYQAATNELAGLESRLY